MDIQKCTSFIDACSVSMEPLNCSTKAHEKVVVEKKETVADPDVVADVDIDIREIYFLIMHFLSAGPCQRTSGQFWNELLEHQLLPRRYHAWYSRSGALSGHENDNGDSFPLSYGKLVERYPHIEKDHLVKLLKRLIVDAGRTFDSIGGRSTPSAVDVPTLLGTGSFSLLASDRKEVKKQVKPLPAYLRWPHMQADQVRGLTLREIGGGFPKHHRAPSIHFACYTVAKPLTMVQKMQNIKKLRGHRDAVYCAIFDHSGRYVITGSDDRLVKIWSMETAFCLASCRGHEGDITDLAISSNNVLVASASNDYSIRVWLIPDGMPTSVLRGHTGAVTAIAFSPRHNSVYQLLSSSDDGTCRIWDARCSRPSLRVYRPKPADGVSSLGKSHGSSSINAPSSSDGLPSHQILCCTYNANGTVFVTGSSDTFARVWSAAKFTTNDSEQPHHEMDVLAGHENDVNYVQFCGCSVAPRSSTSDSTEDNKQKFRNSGFNNDNIVTCSRDGSAIIWVPKSRKSHGKAGRWTRAYHLKVPPPPIPPQPPRGGPRQRLLPTPRGVNMIVWSLDNRFVLAAIMDCRICVWNASDGSLVHSLTGHSESTYVLDVHPFNPRIAMSAGYDGKTIVWDIWEGTPIRTYEIGRFKLVDGKFSPDGTSIVLSDDAGQIYLLNTGQGDSQKDAKYDQFFLGDYRPLLQDSAGNVVDQETQLLPYRRNIQDPLCDSSMIPYAEPYQSMYQRRRLGALSIEWRPSTIKFAIGTDIGLGHEILPLPDLDRVIDPLPEFIEAMYWEPENEVINDDTDSEYNVTDEYSSEGDQRILYSSASSDPEGSEEDTMAEQYHKDGLRRSKRRKHKASDVKLVTSSGRCAKRRNLDEHDGTSSRTKRVKKQKKSGRKTSKKIKVKALRSQRVSSRSATSIFTQISEASADEDEGSSSEDDSSESKITEQDSNMQRNEDDCNLRNVHLRDPKDEQASLYDSRGVFKPPESLESEMSIVKRPRLVLKLPFRGIKKTSENTGHQIDDQANLASSSSLPSREVSKDDRVSMIFEEPGPSSANGYGANEVENDNRTDFRGREPQKFEGHLETSIEDKESKISWGEVKGQTSKQMPLDLLPTDASTGFCATLDGQQGNENDVTAHDKPQNEVVFSSPASLVQDFEGKLLNATYSDGERFESGASERMDGSRCRHLSTEDVHKSSFSDGRRPYDMVGVTNHSNDLKENSAPKPIKLRIKSNKVSRDPERPSQPNDSNRQTDDAGHSGVKLKWSRSNPEGSSVTLGVRVSKATSCNDSSGSDLPEDYVTDVFRRTRSMGLHATSRETDAVNHRFEVRQGLRSSGTSKQKSSKKALEQLPSEEWTRSPKILRGNKGGVYCDDVRISSAPRSQPHPRTSNWLTLSQQEEGCRYIPQLSDEVVYLVQGHQGYLASGGLSEKRPWASIKKNIRAVEFCSVEGLSYSQVPGSGDSCCRITLKFTDPSSTVFGEAFKFTLPELTNYPDFVVERTRYDAAIRRNWSVRDKCQVWWRDESVQGGSWWNGRIVSSKDKSDDFPSSPWERFEIQYDGDSPTTIYYQSPWELYDPESLWEHPHLDRETTDELLSAFAHLQQSVRKNQDPYGILRLNQVAEQPDFINKFPAPLSPDLIESRLKNDYYRSLEAVKHDMRVMLSNAQTYFEKNAEVGAKMKRLSEWFTKMLSNR